MFGRERLDMAVRWGTALDSFAARAFQMYRNYDGAGAKFGDTSVTATAPNVDEVSAFASLRSTDGALTIMLVAKTITRRSDLTPSGATVSLTLPRQSITLLVIPAVPIPAVPIPPAPTLTATATGTAQVALSWTAVAGAVSYDVYRSVSDAPFAPLTNTSLTAVNDNTVSANTTYLYQVRAVLAGGTTAFSALDPATTTAFTDSPLNVGTTIKAVHFTQMRTAVNAIRAAAGLGAQTFTDPALSSAVKVSAVHLTELRTALDAARADLGLLALVYTSTSNIKAAHVTEIRNGVK